MYRYILSFLLSTSVLCLSAQHMHPSTKRGYADSVNNGIIKSDTLKKSVGRTAMYTIGKTHVHIAYSSPGVRNRVVWGGLVPYDEVWVTGAHKATSISFNKDIFIEGRKIKSGTYALFTIPGTKIWQFILNKRYDQHLTDQYNAAEDILRIPMQPSKVAFTPRLTYEVKQSGSSKGVIHFRWERLQWNIPFQITQ
ncbi:MAG TPA: hypothetical protein DIW54_11530 [Chitinophagaceae bacterium]|nr:hypothetical protein [Chitinophagaceae bacterium]HCT23911.1 hypothetical protein [Chitinophagaceae bacterium]